jgi:hypothetical protein
MPGDGFPDIDGNKYIHPSSRMACLRPVIAARADQAAIFPLLNSLL